MAEERLNDVIPLEVTLKYLLKDLKKRNFEIRRLNQTIGELESYVQELEWKVKNISNGHIEFNKEIKREEMYDNLRKQNNLKDKRIKALKEVRNTLLEKLSKYE